MLCLPCIVWTQVRCLPPKPAPFPNALIHPIPSHTTPDSHPHFPRPSLRELAPRHNCTRRRQQQARPTPTHDGQVIVILDQRAHDDRPNDRGGSGDTIHHAGPLAKAPLLGFGKEGSDTRGWEADHSAGNDTEETDESDGTSEIGGEWPEGEDEDGGNEGGREVDVEGTVAEKGERALVGVLFGSREAGEDLLVREIGSQDATDGAAAVCNA